MAYEKQTWVDGVTPLDAEHLNHMEEGIADAVSFTEQTLTEAQKAQARKNIGIEDASGDTGDSGVVGSRTRNQHNPADDTAGVLINADGNETANASYTRTGYIACTTGQKMVATGPTNASGGAITLFRAIEYFDAGFNRLSYISKSNCDATQITTVDGRCGWQKTNGIDGCAYIRICYTTLAKDAYMVEIIAGNEVAIVRPYEPFVAGVAAVTDYWEGKTIVWNGDSIPAGYMEYTNCPHIPYPTLVCSSLKSASVNYAIGGSTIAVQEGNESARNPVVSRYIEMQDDADLVVIAGGTNDWGYAHVPLGDMTSNTKYTFYGALKLLCAGLLEKYLGKHILFLTPIKRWGSLSDSNPKYFEENDNGNTLKDFADAIKEVCEYYGIPVLDMYSECIINPIIPSSAAAFMPDGTHPNYDGHVVLARRITGYIKNMADGLY